MTGDNISVQNEQLEVDNIKDTIFMLFSNLENPDRIKAINKLSEIYTQGRLIDKLFDKKGKVNGNSYTQHKR